MMMMINTLLRRAATAALMTLAAGCVQQGLTDVMQRPAERALLNGLRAYDEGQYAEAERALQTAMTTGLVSAKDRANALKHLAFIYCTSQRAPACEAAFREARAADPEFTFEPRRNRSPAMGPGVQEGGLGALNVNPRARCTAPTPRGGRPLAWERPGAQGPSRRGQR